MKKIIFPVIFVSFFIGIFFGYGFSEWQYGNKIYDDNLLDLFDSILIYDAIKAEKSNEGLVSVDSIMQRKSIEMVMLYRTRYFKDSEYFRCVNSRRLRLGIQKGLFGNNWNEKYLSIIKEYLAAECAGPPSHINWVTKEKFNAAEEIK